MSEENKILLTGFRLLAILKFISRGGASKLEILRLFKENYPFLKGFSMETLKLDINSLKKAGFVIKKKYDRGIYKFYLEEAPLFFKFSKEDYEILNMAKRASLEILSLEENLALRELISSLRELFPEDVKNDLLDFGFLNLVCEQILKDIYKVIKEKKCCTLIYNSPSGSLKKIDALLLDIVFRGSKLYVKCSVDKYNGVATFRLDNISGIENIRKCPKTKFCKGGKIKYAIKRSYFETHPLERFETVINKTPEIVEIEALNEDYFFVQQRILSLGENCIKIENKKMKNSVMKNLKQTLEKYK